MARFRFSVTRTLTLTGRPGIYVLGRIVEGRVRIGDVVTVDGPAGVRTVTVAGVEIAHWRTPAGTVDFEVALHLPDLAPGAVAPGSVVRQAT